MVLDEVVKKEVTKLVEEVNKVLFKECNEGDHKVTVVVVVLAKKADMEVNQAIE